MQFMIFVSVAVCLLIGYLLWQRQELKRFSVQNYTIRSSKLKKEHRVAVLADLHGFRYGEDNEKLILAVKNCDPQLILIAGDMIVSKYPETYPAALQTIRRLCEIAPVYYSFGNHESRAAIRRLKVHAGFQEYMDQVSKAGARILRNESGTVCLSGDEIRIDGLEISLNYYEKGCIVPMESGYVKECLGEPAEKSFQILLAHNPAYSEQYADWGADLTFCGHNHGGLIRIPGIGSLMSPQLTFFPKYSEGLYEIKGNRVLVSRGLGTHTFHIRIFNRAELLCVDLLPESNSTISKGKQV